MDFCYILNLCAIKVLFSFLTHSLARMSIIVVSAAKPSYGLKLPQGAQELRIFTLCPNGDAQTVFA